MLIPSLMPEGEKEKEWGLETKYGRKGGGGEREKRVKKKEEGTSLVVQWLGLCAPNAGGPGSVPGQGARSHLPQLRVCMPQLKILHAATKIPHTATKTQHSQINK